MGKAQASFCLLYVVQATEQPLIVFRAVDRRLNARFCPAVAVHEIALGNGELLQEDLHFHRHGEYACAHRYVRVAKRFHQSFGAVAAVVRAFRAVLQANHCVEVLATTSAAAEIAAFVSTVKACFNFSIEFQK